ncbi:MAG: Calx-beta domain-containing protein, partial [Woeseiaceae bacterium]
MKHKPAPVQGAATSAHVRTTIRPLVRSIALTIAMLAAPSVTLAQVLVSIDASDDTASETPADNGEFVVRRVGGHPVRPVTINYSITGSASAGDDYAPLSGSARLEARGSEVSIAIEVPGNDGVFEGDETVTITMLEEEGGGGGDDDDDDDDDDDGDDDNDDGGVIVVDGTATVTILDSPHSVTASTSANASENPASDGRISVSLGARNESGDGLTVQYSVAGTATPAIDYVALSGVAVIPVGSSSASVDVTPLDDDLQEGLETVEITLTETSDPDTPVGTPATASVSIADDDSAGDDDGDGLSNSEECPDADQCPDTDQDALTNDQDPDDDGDGIPTASENAPGQDTNNDGTPDYLDNDDDGDGRLTRDEDANADGDGNPSTNPTDLDGDDVSDYLDANDRGGSQGDADSDGLSNEREEELGTDPEVADTDGDGVNDGDEVAAATDPLDQRSFADADGDLVPDAIESGDGTDPNDPDSFADGDGGGTADHIETITYATYGITPTNVANANDDRRDFDGDGLPDRLEISIGSVPDADDTPTVDGAGDDNGNGISNAVEAHLATLGIVAVDAVSDMDRDGYPDAAEVALGLNPLRASERDTDGDGVPDAIEVRAGIDIDGTTDSDGDGVPDACEIALGSDPLDANLPIANGAMDDDGDGVSNAIEQVLQTLGASGDIDASGDGDADGISDADEIRFGTDPFRDEQPALWIELSQADIGPVAALVTDGGVVTATAVVGGRQAGTLLYDWTESSNAVLAVSNGGQTNRTLAISPQTLPAGTYNLVLSVQRTVGDYSSPVSTIEFTVSVLDGTEAAQVADADNDGVPDASDDADGRRGFANELQVQSGARMQAETGVRLQLGTTARIAGTRSARVTREDIASAGDGNGGSVGNSEDDFDYVSGIYDFEVTNLPEVGGTVQIVIPQAIAVGEFPEYRKFQPSTGWVNFVEDANNSIESAAGESGACPEPGDDSYQPGLTPGHSCIQLTIAEGGPNDGDAALGPNGVVK